MMNEGKRLEINFKKSIPDDWFIYRLKDAGGWSNATNMRFTSSNICDYMVHNNNGLYLCELKSVKGKSLPLSNISSNQLKGMKDANSKTGVKAFFFIEFRELELMVKLGITELLYHLETTGKKSINYKEALKLGTRVEGFKKKVNTTYNLREVM